MAQHRSPAAAVTRDAHVTAHARARSLSAASTRAPCLAGPAANPGRVASLQARRSAALRQGSTAFEASAPLEADGPPARDPVRKPPDVPRQPPPLSASLDQGSRWPACRNSSTTAAAVADEGTIALPLPPECRVV